MSRFPGARAGRAARSDQSASPADQPYFEIYRADRVKLTSILFSGEDWRWRFCSAAGRTIASGDGFGSEGECVAAVDALRLRAATAPMRGSSLHS